MDCQGLHHSEPGRTRVKFCALFGRNPPQRRIIRLFQSLECERFLAAGYLPQTKGLEMGRGLVENTANELIGGRMDFGPAQGRSIPIRTLLLIGRACLGCFACTSEQSWKVCLVQAMEKKRDPLFAHGMTRRAPLRACVPAGDGVKTFARARGGVCAAEGHRSKFTQVPDQAGHTPSIDRSLKPIPRIRIRPG